MSAEDAYVMLVRIKAHDSVRDTVTAVLTVPESLDVDAVSMCRENRRKIWLYQML